jgi:hypothetical protein
MVNVRIIAIALGLQLIGVSVFPGCAEVDEDGGPPEIKCLYEDEGEIIIEWRVGFGGDFVLRRYRLNEDEGRWEVEYRIPVEGGYYADNENLHSGEAYGYVVEGSGDWESELEAIRYIGSITKSL